MGLDKENSRGGGYVGGFFQLFDWKAKSRKKLFSGKSETSEHSKQGKKNDGNLPATRVYSMDEDESGLWPSSRGNGDYSCASSVTDEEGYGNRGPNVVARLMGLESLPTTSSSEPYSTPFFDTQSLREAEYSRRRNVDYQSYHEMYSGDLIMETEDCLQNHVQSKPQRVVNRPIEKFQAETLPPKSVKTIPITQHKLMSPIKCPGFVPSRNAAHIMEAAAKIIEARPRATGLKGKMPIEALSSSTGQLRNRNLKEREKTVQKAPLGRPSSSVPLRVGDLNEKVEAAQKTASGPSEASRGQINSDTASMRYLRGQSLSKRCNGGSGASSSIRAFTDSEEGSCSSKNNGRSVSLAVQAKVNVQKREQLTFGERSQSMAHLHEHNDNTMTQPCRTQPRPHRNMHKKSMGNTVSGALRQNNQKQNCEVNKEKVPSKSVVSTPQSRKVLQKSATKTVVSTKTGSRKLDVFDGDRESLQSNTENFPRKKRSIDAGQHFEKNKIAGNDMQYKNKRPVQTSSAVQKNFCWAEDSRKKGMDVVSFTFTAPLTRSMMGSESPNSGPSENLGRSVISESDNYRLSSLGYNALGGDALSKLLEQKSQELSYEVGSSSCNVSASLDSVSSSTSVFQDSGPMPDTVTSKPRPNAKREHNVLFDNLSGCENHGNMFDPPSRRLKHEFQGPEDMEVDSFDRSIDSKHLVDSRHLSPISVLEPSFVTESCFSTDSMDSDWTEGNKHSDSQAAALLGPSPLGRSYLLDADMELYDSASSLSTSCTGTQKSTTRDILSVFSRSADWELEYIKEILSDIELMFKELFLGHSKSFMNRYLFEKLEARRGFTGNDDVDSRLKRKLLFDCVSECMESRLSRFVGGGSRAWELGLAMVRRKEHLAEDVYREIFAWRGLVDSMVDNLVDRDMSTQYGRWLDFDPDMFDLEMELEGSVLNSLIDEAISAITQL